MKSKLLNLFLICLWGLIIIVGSGDERINGSTFFTSGGLIWYIR